MPHKSLVTSPEYHTHRALLTPQSFGIGRSLRFWTVYPKVLIWLVLCIGVTHPARGHGDAHGMIQAVTEELKTRPKDPDLYYRRGELFRRHAEWDLAWADYERAERFGGKMEILDLSRGLLLAEAKWGHSALGYLDRYLAVESNSIPALSTRARVHLSFTNRSAAIQDFSTAIARTSDPRPELYLERAQVLMSTTPPDFAEALKGIEQGLEKLGPVVTLQLQAIDLELRLEKTNAAIARLDSIISQSPRKETWQARRGEILMQAQRWSESSASFKESLASLRSLPASRRNAPAMRELERRIQSALTNLPAKSP